MNHNYLETQLENLLYRSLRLKMEEYPYARSHEEKRKRRVAVWAYAHFLRADFEVIQNRFGIRSRQAIYKMLKVSGLPEEEYNWRRLVRREWLRIKEAQRLG